MTSYLTIGIILGLSAGFTPGPLFTLVISETIRHGIGAGVRVALAPIVTDLPIILLAVFALAGLSSFHGVLGCISIAGGCFIVFLAWESFRAGGEDLDPLVERPKSLAKGIAANALSPYPYLFWLSVGAPQMLKAMKYNILALVAFITGFYVCLVGSKILMAVLVGKSRTFLCGRFYIYTMRLLGLILAGFAVILFRDGLKLLGIAR
jgi:threonine/homoserine/homoserine lactone efflux protein